MNTFTVPFTGEVDLDNVYDEHRHPLNVGLVSTPIIDEKGNSMNEDGNYRHHVTGIIDTDTTDGKGNNQTVYLAGSYDFIVLIK